MKFVVYRDLRCPCRIGPWHGNVLTRGVNRWQQFMPLVNKRLPLIGLSSVDYLGMGAVGLLCV